MKRGRGSSCNRAPRKICFSRREWCRSSGIAGTAKMKAEYWTRINRFYHACMSRKSIAHPIDKWHERVRQVNYSIESSTKKCPLSLLASKIRFIDYHGNNSESSKSSKNTLKNCPLAKPGAVCLKKHHSSRRC